MYRLRFDVETISKATGVNAFVRSSLLRFDVETISKATIPLSRAGPYSCGLM